MKESNAYSSALSAWKRRHGMVTIVPGKPTLSEELLRIVAMIVFVGAGALLLFAIDVVRRTEAPAVPNAEARAFDGARELPRLEDLDLIRAGSRKQALREVEVAK